MPYRYNTIDVIVGVGMCAIVFGALLFFVASMGSFQAAAQAPVPVEQPFGVDTGMTWLQPALGDAIVERTLLDIRSDRALEQAAAEWNRATLAHQAFQAAESPMAGVMRRAAALPEEHAARVQTVMGRAIVNFTKRGIRSETFSADLYLSGFNDAMIRATEARGARMDEEFASTWQATLGREIVSAVQTHRRWAESVQEQLGSAIVRLTHAQASAEEALAGSQYQLASLVVAAIRTDALSERLARLAAIEAPPAEPAAPATQVAAWPEVPMSVLIAAAFALMVVFFTGLSLSGISRERKALEAMQRDSARWVYRLAS